MGSMNGSRPSRGGFCFLLPPAPATIVLIVTIARIIGATWFARWHGTEKFPKDRFLLRSMRGSKRARSPLARHNNRRSKTMRKIVLGKIVLGKIVLGLIGSTLIAASMGGAANAAEHQVRHERGYTGERAYDLGYHPMFVSGESALGQSDTPWRKSGLRPDDWRQSSNG
jgi:hypothetical protein